MLNVFAISPGLARLRRANHVGCGVDQALRAWSTPHPKTGERRRREQANVMETRHTLINVAFLQASPQMMRYHIDQEFYT